MRIAHPLLGDVVLDRIASAIVRGDIPTGEQLSVVALADELGVSRTPVRDALRQLEHDGLVVNEPRRGMRVPAIDARETVNFFECRILLQVKCQQLALPHVDGAVIATLDAVLAEMEKAEADGRSHEYLGLVRRFHEAIEAVCPNPDLVDLLRGIAWRAMRFRSVSIRTAGRMASSLAQHRALRDALADRDERRAEALVEELLIASRDAILRSLDEAG
jgi:DNA-binding GntR family transcriptional regulator